MCECLSGWIKNYLLLYKNNFYDVLKNTVCNSDNNVFGELNKLINEQMQHYGNGGDQKILILEICNISNRMESTLSQFLRPRTKGRMARSAVLLPMETFPSVSKKRRYSSWFSLYWSAL